MAVRVAMNGFGRIGRMVLRAAKQAAMDIDFVAINDIADLEPLAMVLRYDSIHGQYPGTVEWREDHLIVDGDEIRVFKVADKRENDTFLFPWDDMNIDVVVEASGLFRRVSQLKRHAVVRLSPPRHAPGADGGDEHRPDLDRRRPRPGPGHPLAAGKGGGPRVPRPGPFGIGRGSHRLHREEGRGGGDP
jgi:hypothetical protein